MRQTCLNMVYELARTARATRACPKAPTRRTRRSTSSRLAELYGIDAPDAWAVIEAVDPRLRPVSLD